MNARRLFRSRTDRVLTGIAGGMAEYLEVDPTVVRILWVLATIFTGGLVLLLYIVLAFVIPVNPYQGGPVPAGAWGAGYAAGAGTPPQAGSNQGWTQPGAAPGTTDAAGTSGAAYATGYAAGGAPAWSPAWNAEYERSRAARTERPGRAGLIIGSVLIVFGVIALADVAIPGWLSGALVVPGLFVALGVGLLVASLRGSSEPAPAAGAPAAPAVAPAPATFVPAEPATASAAEAPAEVDATPFATYDDDATSTLPPQPGSDPA